MRWGPVHLWGWVEHLLHREPQIYPLPFLLWVPKLYRHHCAVVLFISVFTSHTYHPIKSSKCASCDQYRLKKQINDISFTPILFFQHPVIVININPTSNPRLRDWRGTREDLVSLGPKLDPQNQAKPPSMSPSRWGNNENTPLWCQLKLYLRFFPLSIQHTAPATKPWLKTYGSICPLNKQYWNQEAQNCV